MVSSCRCWRKSKSSNYQCIQLLHICNQHIDSLFTLKYLRSDITVKSGQAATNRNITIYTPNGHSSWNPCTVHKCPIGRLWMRVPLSPYQGREQEQQEVWNHCDCLSSKHWLGVLNSLAVKTLLAPMVSGPGTLAVLPAFILAKLLK